MNKGTKGFIAGIGTGTALASAPSVAGALVNVIKKEPKNMSLLQIKSGEIVDETGNPVLLKGINLFEIPFEATSEDLPFVGETADIFNALEKRFGHYGAREVFNCCYEKAIDEKDIKFLAKLGVNCVTIPLRSFLLAEGFKNKKKQIHYQKLDAIISACKKNNIYVILSLETAPGYQNNLADCGKADSSNLFGKEKGANENRAEFVKLWERIATHYKNETAIVAYNLMSKPMIGVDKNIDKLTSLYGNVIKAIRKLADKHIIMLEAPSFDYAENIMAVADANCAFGFSMKCGTVFEMDYMLSQAKSIKNKGYATIGINLFPSDYEKTALTLSQNKIGWCLGNYKGDMCCLYCGEKPIIDLAKDSYDEIKEKLVKAVSTKKFKKNKQMIKSLEIALKE